MIKIRRNGPCPCGSGKKAKRCCHGSGANAARRFLPPELTEDALGVLSGIGITELRAYFDELFHLPAEDLSLQVPLPRLRSAGVDEAVFAIQEREDADFDEDFDELLRSIVRDLDTSERRTDLAWAVIALRDRGRIDPKLVAVALLDLDRPDSVLFGSSVVESLGVLAGDYRTPSGLLVAAR